MEYYSSLSLDSLRLNNRSECLAIAEHEDHERALRFHSGRVEWLRIVQGAKTIIQ